MKNKDKNSVIVSQITNYINKNYYEKISLDFLAEKFFVDKYHMCHIFRKETGITIVDFINQKRITEAGILLKGTGKSVNEISNMVGFPNQNYFGVVFKKQYGKSPREFRLQK
jgi:YesN/AraC family two-component response regulator